MEVRSENNVQQARTDKFPSQVIPRTRLKVWFFRVCSSILLWTCLVHIVAVAELWHPRLLTGFTSRITWITRPPLNLQHSFHAPPPLAPPRNYKSNGFLKVSCNGGLNQMRAAICDMVTVARLLNLTLVVPELDKKSFWADPSDFEDIFDVRHFIDSLRDEVHIIRRLPKRFSRKYGFEKAFQMPPISWSNEKYYLEQIETLGHKLVHILQEKGPFVALHLRYEMDMLAFSGCTHGCTVEEAEELKRLRFVMFEADRFLSKHSNYLSKD